MEKLESNSEILLDCSSERKESTKDSEENRKEKSENKQDSLASNLATSECMREKLDCICSLAENEKQALIRNSLTVFKSTYDGEEGE
jgi:hypothetical protein